MHVAIIGNGITGTTCARFIRKYSDYKITLISGETEHFFSRTALMYIYMGHMGYKETKPYEDWFWEKNRIELKKAWVSNIDFEKQSLTFDSGEQLNYDKLVIACGSKPNKFGWKGQDLEGVQGLYSYQDLELLEKNTQSKINRAVIVGGGLIGIEMAEMLHSRHIPVSFLVRESSYWSNVLPEGESKMINRHIIEHGFDLKLGVNLEEIIDDGNGRAKAVKVKETGEIISCELVGLTSGVSPNIAWLKESDLATEQGILVNLNQETNQKNVYAGGDCAQFSSPQKGRRPIEQVWYTGKMQGKVIAENICGKNTKYNPGHWFNSAKFLDIEYQTYGVVLPNLPKNQSRFYWEHKDGKKCVDMVFETESRKFIGINTFGIRMRHELFDQFLQENRTIDYVLENLRAAAFDPEFYQQHEQEIIKEFNKQTGSKIQLKAKHGLRGFLSLFGK